jgi:hypothetical protein
MEEGRREGRNKEKSGTSIKKIWEIKLKNNIVAGDLFFSITFLIVCLCMNTW